MVNNMTGVPTQSIWPAPQPGLVAGGPTSSFAPGFAPAGQAPGFIPVAQAPVAQAPGFLAPQAGTRAFAQVGIGQPGVFAQAGAFGQSPFAALGAGVGGFDPTAMGMNPLGLGGALGGLPFGATSAGGAPQQAGGLGALLGGGGQSSIMSLLLMLLLGGGGGLGGLLGGLGGGGGLGELLGGGTGGGGGGGRVRTGGGGGGGAPVGTTHNRVRAPGGGGVVVGDNNDVGPDNTVTTTRGNNNRTGDNLITGNEDSNINATNVNGDRNTINNYYFINPRDFTVNGPNTGRTNIGKGGETGKIWGDPHYVGFEGDDFDVQERGVFNVLSDGDLKFNVEHGPFAPNPGTTVITKAGLQVGVDRILMDAFTGPSLNGNPMELNKLYQLDGGSSIWNGTNLKVENGEYAIDIKDQGSHMDIESIKNKGQNNFQNPDGIVGMTLDGDGKARKGAKGANANGEGAFDPGVSHKDYKVENGDIFGDSRRTGFTGQTEGFDFNTEGPTTVAHAEATQAPEAAAAPAAAAPADQPTQAAGAQNAGTQADAPAAAPAAAPAPAPEATTEAKPETKPA